jgi:hypothetical protein
MNESSGIDLRALLLGRLSPQATSDAEEKLVGDEEFFQEVMDAEDELIDEFISGSLSPEDREAFVQYEKHRPGMDERIRMRRAFLQAVQGAAAKATAPAAAVPLPASPRRKQHFWIYGLALAAAAVIAAVVFLYSSHKPAVQVASAPESSAAAPKASSPSPVEQTAPKALGTAILFFPQHVARGATQTAPLELQVGTRHEVEFELEVPAQAATASDPWSMTIANAHGVAVAQKGLHTRQLDSISFVVARFDPTTLAAGSYTVSLSPMQSSTASSTWDLKVIG